MKKLRFIVAGLVLAGLCYFVGLDDLRTVWNGLDPLYICLLLLISVVLVWASCLKWRLFIRAAGNDVPMLHLMHLYTVGYFFNTMAPSVVAGDVARSLHLGQRLNSQRDAFISTFLERFTGLLAMSILSLVFLLFGVAATTGLAVAIIGLGICCAGLAGLCFSSKIAARGFPLIKTVLTRTAPKKFRPKLMRLVDQVNDGMEHARNNPKLLIDALLLSLFFHTLTIINTYVAARSIGWHDPDFAGLFVVVPLVLIAGMAPITPNGLGIQEGAFLFFLQGIGATHAQGLGVGLVIRAKAVLLAIVGGLLWMGIRERAAVKVPPPVNLKCVNDS